MHKPSVNPASHHSHAIANPMHPFWNDSSNEATGIFGLPFVVQEASVVIVPVPWEAACSQGIGTANAPALILEQSRYVELHDPVLGNIYERGIAMETPLEQYEPLVRQSQSLTNQGGDTQLQMDSVCQKLNHLVQNEISHHLSSDRATGLLGGDHSVSFGSIAAHIDAFPDIGILQIDAHADLRPSLDGMTWSHASVMWHVMESLQPVSLTQVGIRGLCSVERAYQTSNEHIVMFSDHDMQLQLANGQTWTTICDAVIDSLPHEIYITLDIDGLDPSCCPHTGTPVPGGLSFTQLLLLLHRVRASGRIIRGFDLVEVGGRPCTGCPYRSASSLSNVRSC